MDLHRRLTAQASDGLPRTRGDGPSSSAASTSALRAPPHPRGWTRRPPACTSASAGSPAPAGMDRRGCSLTGTPDGLPRTRGDGPREIDATARRIRAPPHPSSEEHTSELQSLMRISYAVFCLKKKNNTQQRKRLHR